MKTNPNSLHCAAVSATGCSGAMGYMQRAQSLGYNHLEVLDWTSSAGDWSFLVSKDGQEWHMLFQTNNYPRPGFSYAIDERPDFGLPFFGTAKDAIESACELVSM